jgi:hypothetical protein
MLLCEAEGGQSAILRTNKICIYSRIVKKKYMNSGEVSFFSYTVLRFGHSVNTEVEVTKKQIHRLNIDFPKIFQSSGYARIY